MLENDKEISEELLREKFEENKEEFAQKESVQARHILLKLQRDATKADEDKVLAKAQKLAKRARAGEDFATVAAEAAAVPQTPLPRAMRTQAGLPWKGPSTRPPSFIQ